MHPCRLVVLLTLGVMGIVSCRPVSNGAEQATAASGSLSPPAQASQALDEDAPSTRGLGPGDYEFSLDHDGRRRRYIVHVPPTVLTPAPVVVALHGGGGTGADFQDQNGLDAVADRDGFVVMYPDGTGILPNRLHTWNSGEHCCGYAFDHDVDDVGFLRTAIADVATHIATDADRIYVTGHSNGAMMAYRLAVEAPDVVAAVVPVGGAVDLAGRAPAQPVPLLHIHSADDPRANYDGGEGPPFPGTTRTVFHEPVLPGIQSWADSAGCAQGPALVDAAVGSGDDEGHRYELFTWQDCPDGIAVEHLVLYGSGHGWPGVTAPRLVQRHLGPPTTLVHASEAVWAFVSQFRNEY